MSNTPNQLAYVLRGFADGFGLSGSGQYAALCQVLRDTADTLERADRNVRQAIHYVDGLPLLIEHGTDVTHELDRIRRCLDYALGAPVHVPDASGGACRSSGSVIPDMDDLRGPMVRHCEACED